MAVLKIEMLGSEVLRRTAEPVAEIDDGLRLLIADMFETMYDAEGIGLAAPQVGVSRRVIVVDVKEEGQPPFAMINPRIVQESADREKGDEGCLSIPGLAAVVDRPARVVVEGLDERGEPMVLEADGLLGRCLQHEIDHLNGVLFIDHLSPLKRSMLVKRWKSRQPDEPRASRGRQSEPVPTRE